MNNKKDNILKPESYGSYDTRTIIIVMAIRQAKLRQELLWLKQTTVLASTVVGGMQALILFIELVRDLFK